MGKWRVLKSQPIRTSLWAHGTGNRRFAVTAFHRRCWTWRPAVPRCSSSPEQRPSMQQQRINKSFTRLVPCCTVSQANALNFDCEPDLCDLICARHVTPLVTALPWRTIPSLGATGRGKLEAAPFALLCWSCLSCESLLQEKHKPPMFSPGREVTEWITENRLPSFTLCLSNILVEN